MHTRLARELISMQRNVISDSLKQQESAYHHKGFSSTVGLPLIVDVVLDPFELADLLVIFMQPIKMFNNLLDAIKELLASEYDIHVDQLLVHFVYKNVPIHQLYTYFCPNLSIFSINSAYLFYKLFNDKDQSIMCTIKGVIVAASDPVYDIIATSFKCTNGHCLRHEILMTQRAKGMRMSVDGERLWFDDNGNVCHGCRMQMTEMTPARVFQKTIYLRVSINERFAPIDVTWSDLPDHISTIGIGSSVAINGYAEPVIVNNAWKYSFRAVKIEEQPASKLPRGPETGGLFFAVQNAIRSYGTSKPSVLHINTQLDITSVIRTICEMCTIVGCCQTLDDPEKRQTKFKQKNDLVEGGKIVYTCHTRPQSTPYLCIISKTTKRTPFTVAKCRQARIPVIFIGDEFVEEADCMLFVTDDTLIDVVLNINDSGHETIRFPPSPAPSSKHGQT